MGSRPILDLVRKRAVVIAAAIGALGVTLMPVYAEQTESGQDTCFHGHAEGTQAEFSGWSWWPLGSRCALVLPDGERLVQVVPPWQGTADWSRIRTGG